MQPDPWAYGQSMRDSDQCPVVMPHLHGTWWCTWCGLERDYVVAGTEEDIELLMEDSPEGAMLRYHAEATAEKSMALASHGCIAMN